MRLALSLLFVLLPTGVPGATYVAPDEIKPLFKRDRAPIDTDTMRELSGYLTDVARRKRADDPAQLRATAQLLAIATRLDPANRPARDVSSSLLQGLAVDPPEADLNHSLKQAWGISDWLVSEEAGPEGQLLGHLIIDALATINPRSPLAKLQDPQGEGKRWRGIVEPLRAYGPAQNAVPPPRPSPPPPKPPPVVRPPILARTASIQTPLFLYDKDLRRHLRIVRVSMNVSPHPEPDLFTFSLSPAIESPQIDTARNNVRSSLQRSWPILPIQQRALLSTGQEHYASKNEEAIAGPAALLMHAALSGKTLRDDVLFIAGLQSDGLLTRPRQSWDYLRVLRVAPGGRLLVSPQFEPELRSLLAMEEPSFFLKWEVLLVDSVTMALSLASGSDPEGLAATAQSFAELRQISEGKDVGQLCVNAHVRQRLSEILSQAPFHYSARMLLAQGNAVERPTRLDRQVTARVLRSAVEPLTALVRTPLEQLTPDRLATTAAASQAEIDRFSNFFAPKDNDLLKEASELAKLTHTIGRGKLEGTRDHEGILYYRKIPVSTYYRGLETRLSAFLDKLAPFTGDLPRQATPAEPQKTTSLHKFDAQRRWPDVRRQIAPFPKSTLLRFCFSGSGTIA